jgi:uncharacterized membrane protein
VFRPLSPVHKSDDIGNEAKDPSNATTHYAPTKHGRLCAQGEFMKDLLTFATEKAVVIINAMALLILAIGTIEVFLKCLHALFKPSVTGHDLRDAYLRYARWLIVGLTLQLAADIVETAIAPSWDDIGRMAAIAVIRTFLNYFLERDVLEARERQHEEPERA